MCRPLVLILLFYICGILVGQYFQIPMTIVISSILVFLVFGLNNELRAWRKNRIYFLVCIMFLGLLVFQYQAIKNRGNITELADRYVVLVGTIVEEPDVRVDKVNYIVRFEDELTGEFKNQALKGCLMVTVNRTGRQFSYGDRVEIEGFPSIPQESGNPGEFSYRDYLQARGIQLTLKIWNGSDIRKVGQGKINALVDSSLRFKQALSSVLQKTMSHRDAGLMDGILFGSCGQIDPVSRNDFALTGVVHILSVSGYHVALLAGLCMILANLAGLNRFGQAGLTIVITAVYTIMTGASPPAVRALIMAWVIILARNTGNRYDWSSSLSLAALAILGYNPLVLFNAGFQLSFLATWGIFYLAPLMQKRLAFLPYVGQGVAVTLAAQIAVMPLTSYYFSYFSLVSVPANLVIVPLISLTMFTSGFAALMGLLWLPVAEIINVTTGAVLQVVLLIAHYLAQLPFAIVTIRQPEIIEILSFYFLLGAVVESFRNHEIRIRLRRFWSLQRQWIIVVGLASTAVLLWTSIIFSGQGYLEVTFLNIGQGDAALIKTPLGKNVVLDTGGVTNTGSSAYNPGEKILVPFLRRKGITSIDLLLLSHAHADHIQGAIAVLQNINVKSLVVSPQFCDNADGAQLVNSFIRKGTEIRVIAGGEKVICDEKITLEAFSPQAEASENVNNDSLVLRLGYGAFHILFTGDAELDVLQKLKASPGILAADIIKVPHHGSKNGWLKSFYQAVNPKLAVISVGLNYFGHPSKDVIEGLGRLGIKVLRTDQNGAIMVRSDGNSYEVETGKEMN